MADCPGKRVQEALDVRGVTQAALAVHVGVEVKTINRLCRGRTHLRPDLASRIARALELSLLDLLVDQAVKDCAKAALHLDIQPIGVADEPA